MYSFSCFVPGDPRPGGSKKAFIVNNRAVIVDAAKGNKEWRAEVQRVVKQTFEGPPIEGPVCLTLRFQRTRPKSHFGTGKNSGVLKADAPREPITRPDVLKLARSVEDSLTGVLYADDAQITSEILLKRFAPESGVEIEMVWND